MFTLIQPEATGRNVGANYIFHI